VKIAQKIIRIHIICWLVFIIYEVNLTTIVLGYFPSARYISFYILNISLFYFHSIFLLRYTTQNSLTNLWRIATLLIFEFIAYYITTRFFTLLLNRFLYNESILPSFFDQKYLSSTFYRAIQFILYGTGYYFLVNYIRKREKSLIQDIENEKLKNYVLRSEQDF